MAKTFNKKILATFLGVCIVLTICTVSNSIPSHASSTNEGASDIVFARWDTSNSWFQWTNPSAAVPTYYDDGSMDVAFTGNNNGQPQCIAAMRFNNDIAKKALAIALQGSKKLEFNITFLDGKNTDGTQVLNNQCSVYMYNSTATISYSNASYLRVHRVVLDVSSLTTSTSFDNYYTQIQVQNYGGSGFKDAKINISPIVVVKKDNTDWGFTKPATEFVQGIKLGWNLGNTFESYSLDKIGLVTPTQAETMWWNPSTTQTMINTVKNAGFNAVRIPCTWKMFVSESGGVYSINPAYLARVKEVVDYCVNNNMYTILNMHHDDNSWLAIAKTGIEWSAIKEKYAQLWTIIGNYFKNYDSRLILEGTNEPIARLSSGDDWWGADNAYFTRLNELHTVFVNTVRATGGNNASRYLMIPTYGAQFYSQQMSRITVPNNDPKVIVDVHWYTASTDESNLRSYFGNFNYYFKNNNIAMLLGECGITNSTSEATKVLWARKYIKLASEYNIKCFLWDDGGDFRILNRTAGTWTNTSFINAVMSNSSATKDFNVPTITAKNYTGSAITPTISITGLVQGTHYNVVYANNTNVGKAAVFITGLGTYADYKVTRYFNIIPATSSTNSTTSTIPTTNASNNLMLSDFEDGSISSVVKGHYVAASVENGAGANGSKALKLAFGSVGYIPGEDTFNITLTPEQVANSTGMRLWIKGNSSDFTRTQFKYYTKHIDATKTENYRTSSSISLNTSGSYFTINWGDQASLNWYHDGSSSWNFTVPTVAQMQASLYKIGISFALPSNTAGVVLYVDNIELLN